MPASTPGSIFGRRGGSDLNRRRQGLDLNELARHYRTSDTTVSLLWFSDEDLPEVEVNRFGVREVDDGGLAELTGELPWPGKNRKR